MNADSRSQRAGSQPLVLAAFATVYLVWGSTYLGIRFALETIPPFLLGGMRFLLAGSALYLWLRCVHRVPAPSRPQWRHGVVAGTLMLGLGASSVNWAQQQVPSGITALVIAVAPLWFVLLDWARPGGTRPHLQTLAGIGVGFGGMILLVLSRGTIPGAALDLAGVVVLLFGSFAWSAGSLYSRYQPKPDSLLMTTAMQMLAGGALMLLAGLCLGEHRAFSLGTVSARSWTAFAYLTVAGSLVGFTAYTWLLKASTPARVSTYAYINPVIALFLGWAVAGEKLSPSTIWAAAIILLGVATTWRGTPSGNLTRQEARPPRPARVRLNRLL